MVFAVLIFAVWPRFMPGESRIDLESANYADGQ